MVKDPGEYNWSSYPINALEKVTELCTPHPGYLKLSKRKDARMRRYRALFNASVDGDLLAEIRSGLNKGIVLGNDKFKDEVEKLTGRRLKPQKVGRPVGWRKKIKDD